MIIGLATTLMLWLDNATWKTAGLLALAIWSFCRFYYFAFYVIEKYVDSQYKFSGLFDFAKYLFGWRR